MDIKNNIARFEAELTKVQRPGMDKLLDYIRKSDFYTAPASTKFHLSCEGGLLQHSLNVLDALRGLLSWREVSGEEKTGYWEYRAAGQIVYTIPDESVVIVALLHDICKTYFYSVGTRNVKNEKTNRWEKQPYYTIEDKMPLGHDPKSAMIIKQYMELTTPEMYAIWWHMGFNGSYENDNAVGRSIEIYPIVLALQTADMMASRFMEGRMENQERFTAPASNTDGECADNQPSGDPIFEEAPPLSGEA